MARSGLAGGHFPGRLRLALTPFRDAWFRVATRVYGPGTRTRPWTWIGDERIAVGSVPTPGSLQDLAREGVTHVVNCRARTQTHFSQDLSAERQVFGDRNVAVAPMWDHGRHQPPAKWARAAEIAAGWLDDDPDARVLIHCQRGRRRSLMVAYAVLRLRGRSAEAAARDLLGHRYEARLVPTYRRAVEEWLATGARPIHQADPDRVR